MSFENDFFQALQKADFNFEEMAIELFRFQAANVPLYADFLNLLNVKANEISSINQIPFLPVSFFKTNEIITKGGNTSFYFTSSTTSGGTPSKHFVPQLELYEWSFKEAFKLSYNIASTYCFLGLLPNYLERGGSSLVYMVDQFIKESEYATSNFYLDGFDALHFQLKENEKKNIPTILIGVTYALLDFALQYPMALKNTIVMETGGMKGRRKEMLRSEVHSILCDAFKLSTIHSEYGMTELLSQAYSKGNGIFRSPPWMRVLAADLNDALTILPKEKAGSINSIDLANIHSCAFIATDDLGLVHNDDSFEILGRKDNSDIRGCGLMYSTG